MTSVSSTIIELPTIRTPGTRYDEKVKALAYQVYSRRAAGDMPETLRILEGLVDPPLSKNTVYQWREDHGWDDKMLAERAAFGEELWKRWCQELAVAAPEAIRYLKNVMDDPNEPTRNRLNAAKTITGQYAQMAEAALESFKGEQGTGRYSADDLEHMTTEELLAYEVELASQT